jgi:hypothetical protein
MLQLLKPFYVLKYLTIAWEFYYKPDEDDFWITNYYQIN